MLQPTAIKVSIVIPVYNTENYVVETVESILNQTLKEIEIIIINDGSTDNSFQLVRSLALRDQRIRFYTQQNKGLSETRNYGIELAKGEYIYFMDSDDILSPTALMECYQKSKSCNLDFLIFDAEVFGAPNRLNLKYKRGHLIEDNVYNGRILLEIILNARAWTASACLSFIDLSFLKRTGLTFYPKILHEDELFTFYLFLSAHRIGRINKAFFKRRLRPDSIMGNKLSRADITGYFTVAREIFSLKKNSQDTTIDKLIDTRLKFMFKDILYSSRSLKFKDRTFVFYNCFRHYRQYSPFKDLLLVLFPGHHFFRKFFPYKK